MNSSLEHYIIYKCIYNIKTLRNCLPNGGVMEWGGREGGLRAGERVRGGEEGRGDEGGS